MDRKRTLIGIICGTGILLVAFGIMLFGNFGDGSNLASQANNSNQSGGQSGMPSQNFASIEGNELFPDEIEGVPLVQYIDGQEALEKIAMLHGTEIETEEGYIASYSSSNGKAITVWLSVDPKEKASELFEVMDEKIAGGATPFQERTEINIGEQKIISVTGMGQDHYYWVQDKENIWVAFAGFEDSEEILDSLYDILK